MLERIAYWTLPAGIYRALRERQEFRRLTRVSPQEHTLLQRNADYRDRHRGQRCFVVATGPSIRAQDLRQLRGEVCLTVSDFYRHEHFRLINPAYHFLAPIHVPFTPADAKKRLLELMEQATPGLTCFCALRDRPIVDEVPGATERLQVRYMKLEGLKTPPPEADLTATLPSVGSVSLMALWAAVYMGFAEIYLLGCDHNHIWKWDGAAALQMEHFYQGAPSIGYLPFDVDKALTGHLAVRQQYKALQRAAAARGARIINASPGSYLDFFPRAKLEDVVRPAPLHRQ